MLSSVTRSIAKPMAFACILLLMAVSLRAAEPTSPREVGLAFAKAVRAGDIAAAKKYAVGSEKSYQTLEIMVKTWPKLEAFVKAAEETTMADRPEIIQGMKQMFCLEPDLETQAARAVETIKGDTATLTDPPAQAPQTRPADSFPTKKRDALEVYVGDPVMLKRVEGKWKVDLDETFAAKLMTTDKDIAEWTNAQAEIDKMLAAIKSGQIPKRSGAPATLPAK